MYFQILGKGKRTTINTILLVGPVAMEVLQQVEQHIIQLGTDLAHCSVVGRPRFLFAAWGNTLFVSVELLPNCGSEAFSGLRLHGHMAGTVHISQSLEELWLLGGFVFPFGRWGTRCQLDLCIRHDAWGKSKLINLQVSRLTYSDCNPGEIAVAINRLIQRCQKTS